MSLLKTALSVSVFGSILATTNVAGAVDMENKAVTIVTLTEAATGYFIEQLSRRTGSAIVRFGDGTFMMSRCEYRSLFPTRNPSFRRTNA
jgi:hypothetical protein